MPDYFYTAKSFDGTTQTGTLDALDESQLAQNLKRQNLVLIRAQVQDGKARKGFNMSISLLGVSSTEKIMMAKNLGVMFAAGLSLVKSFDILSVQAKNQKLKTALIDIKEKINKGESLSDSMDRYPKIFSELFVNMVRVGEESGTLEDIFQILSLQLTKEHELRSKIINAMVYPCIILATMLAIGGIIITFVLPTLNTFFTVMNADIPVYTRFMLDAGSFLATHWYLLIIVPLALVLLLIVIIKTALGKRLLDGLLLKTPLISPIVKKNNSAALIRSLSSLIASGVPLVRSLEITSKTLGNHYFKNVVLEAAQRIKKGEKLSTALQSHKDLFPFGVVEMVEVGEETGKTSAILKKLADFYEQEAIAAVEKLTIIIEPMLIVVLGLAVGLFAFSIIQPMYSSLRSIE